MSAAPGCHDEVVRYLDLLHGREPRDSWVDLRYRGPGDRMRERFRPVHDRDRLAAEILTLAETADVYVGCAPRRLRHGGVDAIARGWILWADVDTPAAAERLAVFTPTPSLVIASGTTGNAHGYWGLSEPLAPDSLRHANRRLAHALGADMAATDAARILRPPGTLNHKTSPPRPVEALRWDQIAALPAHAVIGALPDPPAPAAAPRTPDPKRNDDPLFEIPPRTYVAALLGHEPDREGKVPCPFHADDSPSLHVYETGERGWYCFGCGAGGSIYDLAARLTGMTPRGRAFLELREWLYRELSLAPAATGALERPAAEATPRAWRTVAL